MDTNEMPKPVYHKFGVWQQVYKISNVICPDGVQRVAMVGEADTYWTCPAKMKVKGKTVSGYCEMKDDYAYFHQSQSGKNNHVFWNSPEDARQWIIENIVPNGYFENYEITAPNWQVKYFHTLYTSDYTITITH